MITLYLREHGTHNSGYSIDFKASLDNYNDSEKLLDDLFEYTKRKLESFGHEYSYDEIMEEWLITDYEFDDDFSMNIDEYDSLDRLININNQIKGFEKVELKLITALMDNGFDFDETIKKITDGDVLYFEGTLEDWCYEMVEEGLFGDVSEALKSFINYKDMAFALSCNDGYYEYDETLSYCLY
jgi:hypothetical protein